MKQNYTIIAFTENKPGVLYRISDLFLRRKVNIESLTVSEIETKGISRFTIVVHAEKELVEKIVKQLYRIIEVIKVFESTDQQLVFKEIGFIKVSTKTPERRREVEELAFLFRAKIGHVGVNSLVIEKVGSEEEIDSLFTLLRPFGIKEFVRSGRIAVLKDDDLLQGSIASVTPEASHIAMSLDMTAIKKIQLMCLKTPGAISLAQGVPSFATPEYIKEAAKTAIINGNADKYTPSFGIEPLREEIAKKVKKFNNIEATKDNVIVTHGATEAMMAIFMSLFNPEDEIVILTPAYATHLTQIRLTRNSGKPIMVPLAETENGWELDVSRIESSITRKTKAILFSNPTNPIGKVYTEEELQQIAAIAKRHNLFILTDEMYEYFTFDEKKHISIGSFPDVADRTISIFGLSKTYAMTGWRIGYIVAGKSIRDEIVKVNDAIITSPTAVSQYAALAALQGGKETIEIFKQEFQKRRDIVVAELMKTDKLSFEVTQGGYYIFPKIEFELDDYDFAVEMLKEAKVGVVPGSAFGIGGENHIRISFGGETEDMREGARRFVEYINKKL